MNICGPAFLFAPAGRAEIIPKAAAKADMVILDLEDGAGNVDRDVAYANIRDCGLDSERTIVRIVGPTDPNFARDLEFVRTSSYTNVMIPKVYESLPEGLDGFEIIAMIETPQAVINMERIAKHPSVVGLFWGAEDLTVGLGGTHSRRLADEPNPGPYRATMAHVRTMMLLHAAAAGKFAIDAVYADFNDPEGMRIECVDACRSGFAGSACIHPKQVETVRAAYAPDEAQIAWAEKVVQEAAKHPGAFKLEGEMIDAPLISQARRVIARKR